jgi:hypothetical protein
MPASRHRLRDLNSLQLSNIDRTLLKSLQPKLVKKLNITLALTLLRRGTNAARPMPNQS